MDLKKKMGPLPVWAWGLILGVAGYYVYSRRKAPSSGAGTNPAVLDPNTVDPNTGLTYGQEEQAGLSGLGSPVNGTAPATGNLTTGTNELGDLESFLTEFKNVADLLNVPASTTTMAAAQSPPIVNNYITVPSTATAHTPVTGHAILQAPSGHKPADKPGFTTVGIGGGKWVYVPIGHKPTGGIPAGFSLKGLGGGKWTLVRASKPAVAAGGRTGGASGGAPV